MKEKIKKFLEFFKEMLGGGDLFFLLAIGINFGALIASLIFKQYGSAIVWLSFLLVNIMFYIQSAVINSYRKIVDIQDDYIKLLIDRDRSSTLKIKEYEEFIKELKVKFNKEDKNEARI